MKAFGLILVLALAGCSSPGTITAPTQALPSTPPAVSLPTQEELAHLTIERVGVQRGLTTQAAPLQVGTCKWRNAGVRAYIDAGGQAPTILDVFSDPTHKVYLAGFYSDPGSAWYWMDIADYRSSWCVIG